MRKPCIAELIFQKTFPRPKQGDPVSFYAHIQRHIVGEVRVEVQNYYGALDTLEAQYPGLDYTFPPHRRRLTRYPWHRRLFRVFDELGITNDEILSLCQWEGTRAAKERYEREAGVEVKTTTADDVVAAPVGSGPRAIIHDLSRPASEECTSDSEAVVQTPETADAGPAKAADSPSPEPADDFFEELRDAMQSRLRGEPSAINQAWEQWLKETLERHEMDVDSVMSAIQSLGPTALSAARETGSDDSDLGNRVSPPLSPTPSTPSDSTRSFHAADPLDDLEADNTVLPASSAAPTYFLRRSQTEAAR